MSHILFICTGNTCRSPMAAGLYNMLAARAGKRSRAASCGLSVPYPLPAAAEAVSVAAQAGFDLRGHRAQPVSETLLAEADRVYCMTQAQIEQLRRAYPALADKLLPLPHGDVPDPYGGGETVYRACLRQLIRAVTEILEAAE